MTNHVRLTLWSMGRLHDAVADATGDYMVEAGEVLASLEPDQLKVAIRALDALADMARRVDAANTVRAEMAST